MKVVNEVMKMVEQLKGARGEVKRLEDAIMAVLPFREGDTLAVEYDPYWKRDIHYTVRGIKEDSDGGLCVEASGGGALRDFKVAVAVDMFERWKQKQERA